ncbi:MAG TPA: type II secretion system protein [Polyangiales bacterium]|nr:type II secretion system protein [Polyangiales bacterium]
MTRIDRARRARARLYGAPALRGGARRADRRKREGMTLIEIMVVMVIMALVATAAGFAIVPQITKARIKQTSADAKAIASAAEMYLTEHDGCPTIDELLSEKILDKNKNTKDSWGNAFTIECNEDGATVTSAGPDEQTGTEDDIH